jgi:hypothetical protein
MRRLLLWAASLALAAAGGLAVAPSAEATPIGPSCGTCQGSIHEVTYDATPVAPNTWRITYTIDTSGYSGGGVALDTVSLKVSSSIADANLISAPGGIMNWVQFFGGLNANGCSGSGSGFDCVTAMAISATPVPDGVYTWVFDIQVPTGGLLTGALQSTVKARYVDGSRHKVGALVSENITLGVTVIPEPSEAILLLLGGTILAARHPRRR